MRQRELTRVTHLDLSRNDLGDAGLAALARWIEMGSLILSDGVNDNLAIKNSPNKDIISLELSGRKNQR